MGEWLLGAQVPLEQPWRGRAKLVQMLAMAIRESLEPFPMPAPRALPLLLCVAEQDRPGRLEGLDTLLDDVRQATAIEFHPDFSGTIPKGRVGVAVALGRARQLIYDHSVPQVLVAAADSLLIGSTLSALDAQGRLLKPENADGFIPGEAAGAVVLAGTPGPGPHLDCLGIGFGLEPSATNSEVPLRADGLTQAINQSLADAGCAMHDLDFRITDNSGEQYYFKEAALALSRTMRQRKEAFDIWHPADCIGETGAAIGVATLAVALAASRKGYAIGPSMLLHLGSDIGERAAAVLRYAEPA
jgi:3-oxoacyl-[acyl-carrier-protein] synthase-1